MLRSATQVITGPEAVKQMNRVHEEEQRRDRWPFPWIYPPDSAEPIFRAGSIEAPAYGSDTEVLLYKVPAGLQFALCEIIQIYVGASYVPGSGDILWTLDMDAPVGVTALQANPLPGLFQIPVPLGALIGPNICAAGLGARWQFKKPFIIKPETELRSKVKTVQNVSTGSPNFCLSVFNGFTWPV